MPTLKDDLPSRLRAWVLGVDNFEFAAQRLKPFLLGEDLFFERFGRSPETERVFNAAAPRKITNGAIFDYLTPDAAANLLETIERDHIYKQLTGYYERLRTAQEALGQIDPDCHRRDWIRVGMSLRHEFGADGFFLWDSWSRRGRKYPGETELRQQWASFRDHDRPVAMGSIVYLAKGGGSGG